MTVLTIVTNSTERTCSIIDPIFILGFGNGPEYVQLVKKNTMIHSDCRVAIWRRSYCSVQCRQVGKWCRFNCVLLHINQNVMPHGALIAPCLKQYEVTQRVRVAQVKKQEGCRDAKVRGVMTLWLHSSCGTRRVEIIADGALVWHLPIWISELPNVLTRILRYTGQK